MVCPPSLSSPSLHDVGSNDRISSWSIPSFARREMLQILTPLTLHIFSRPHTLNPSSRFFKSHAPGESTPSNVRRWTWSLVVCPLPHPYHIIMCTAVSLSVRVNVSQYTLDILIFMLQVQATIRGDDPRRPRKSSLSHVQCGWTDPNADTDRRPPPPPTDGCALRCSLRLFSHTHT